VKQLDSQGIEFALSNSDTDFIRDLYQDFHIMEIPITRKINPKREHKTEYELLIKNKPFLAKNQARAVSQLTSSHR
jgi:DNA adenine methylase